MSIILVCVLPLIAILVLYISFQTRDEGISQIYRTLSALIFLLSFLFSPLLIKLVMVLGFLIAWPYIVANLSLSQYFSNKDFS